MNIAVFGLGYVGVITSACFAKMGHTVVAVDVIIEKVEMINEGVSPIIEKDISELIYNARLGDYLTATTSSTKAVNESEVIFVCVGTPSRKDGTVDFSDVSKVASEIAECIKTSSSLKTIVFRSTVPPGTVKEILIPKLESISSKKHGVDFEVIFHPEFLREGSSVDDFFYPPLIIYGEDKEGSYKLIDELYGPTFKCKKIVCKIEEAELVKYVSNIWHALKIGFANEVGTICHHLHLNSDVIMNIFNSDTSLNISAAYLKPGFAFGGSCLPKDTKGLLSHIGRLEKELPIIANILPSNNIQIKRAIDYILDNNFSSIAVLGLTFKEGTDDLRESPIVSVLETLIGKGIKVKVLDKNLNISRLIGKNRSYIDSKLPHLSRLLVENFSDLSGVELFVLFHKVDESIEKEITLLKTPVLDLTVGPTTLSSEFYNRLT